jgi:uncharacterized protein
VIYADSNVVIRLIEGDTAARAPLEARLQQLRGTGPFLLTSRLTRLECRVKPLREGNVPLLALYDEFFVAPEVGLSEITKAVIEKATDLRASLNVKTPDAIHLASAILGGVTAFLAGDHDLARCTDITVEIL